MRRRTRTIGVGVAIVVVVAFLFLVPVIPMTAHFTQHCNPYLMACFPYYDYNYYGSVSYFVSGVGLTYMPKVVSPPVGIPAGFVWSPNLPR